MKKKVLILTNQQDIHADLVIRELGRMKIPTIRLHTDEFPTSVEMSYQNDDMEVTISSSRKSFLASEVGSVWYRRPKPPKVSPEISDETSRNFARNESEHMLENFYALLEPAHWVNPLLAGRRSRSKLLQKRFAKKYGLTVPDTLVTNSPKEAKNFIESCEGRVIYKAVRTGLVHEPQGTSKLIFTTKLGQSDIERLESVAIAPCMFQEYIEKKFEVRATLVGNDIFSCSIHSQEQQDTMTDWREGKPRYEPYKLPESVVVQLRSIMNELGLVYGAFDLILTPEGKWVMLEVNSNGQWAFVEGLTNQPIAKSFALLLSQQKEIS